MPETGIVGSYGSTILVSKGTSILFSILVVAITFIMNSVERFPFLHTLSYHVCRLFNNGHSDRCEVIPHFSFDLHFSNN